eukprot:6460460-Pyramimonas_sp.AAC.2
MEVCWCFDAVSTGCTMKYVGGIYWLQSKWLDDRSDVQLQLGVPNAEGPGGIAHNVANASNSRSAGNRQTRPRFALRGSAKK